MREHLVELFAQASFHHVFCWVNTVFSQATWLDIAIEEHYVRALPGEFTCSEQASRAGADNGY